jgi:toxin ParE1/3/4
MAPDPRTYRLSPKAERDLEDIWRFSFQKWSRAQADAYYGNLIEAFENLAKGDRKGRPIDGIQPGYLSLACGSHFIIHVERGRRIEIIRILHRRMNIGRHL